MIIALVVALSLGAGPAPELGPPWDGESFRGHVDGAARVAFEVPLTGFLLEARHFEPRGDGADDSNKVKHLLTLSGPGGPDVTVDVWESPRPVDVVKFVDAWLGFLRDADTTTVSVAVTPRRVEGLLFAQPRSGQSFGRLTAVFAVGARVFRITCLDKDDVRARAVFERVLETFDAEPRR